MSNRNHSPAGDTGAQSVLVGDHTETEPRNAWISWDRHPWRHPWLTYKNLRKMREFSVRIWQEAKHAAATMARRGRWSWFGQETFKYGFVGNIANSLYCRAAPLRKAGIDVRIFLHPHDTYVMSQPGWEEFDGELRPGVNDVVELSNAGIALPRVQHVYQIPMLDSVPSASRTPRYITPDDYRLWSSYLCYLPTIKALREMDALLATQAPYLAYLSHRPYLVTQMGGDIWYECSRDDVLGRLQRLAFQSANAFLVSNPWSFAHARRFGMQHLIYLPLILDQDVYSPGSSIYREEWIRQSGGDFFVLSTARMDDFYKGSNLALQGFVNFSRQKPNARLVLVGWGGDRKAHEARFHKYGIADKVIVLPIAGKKRLIQYLRAADCLLDQFVLGYYGATALEAMACGLPVIMRLERSQYDGMCLTGAPPVLNADSSEKICTALLMLSNNPQERHTVSRLNREWFLVNHGSTEWRKIYSDMLFATAAGHKFDFSQSPLQEPLSRDEEAYHADGLANAPEFPNYR